MASSPKYFDRVMETSTTAGTGTYTLAGAVIGHQSFAAVGNGNSCYYCAMDVDANGNPSANGWEVGIGTYTLAGTLLSRDTILASTNANAAVNWAAGTRRIFLTQPAVAGSKVVQIVNTETGAAHGPDATTIPYDNTIPQITEGTEYMTLAITPTNSSNKLRIDVVVVISSGSGAVGIIAALFQDATANALAVSVIHNEAGTALQVLTFTHYMTAGTTSSTTFRVRAGASTGTTTFNGGAATFGGVCASSITITEIIP